MPTEDDPYIASLKNEIEALRDKVIEQGRHADFLQNKLNSAEKQLCEIAQFLGRDAGAEGVSSIAEVVRQDAEQLRQQVVELWAIVRKLPKTADGVPVTPGMDLWSVDGGGCYQWLVEVIKSNGVVSGSFHDQFEGPHDAESCYFTRKAAEAAKP